MLKGDPQCQIIVRLVPSTKPATPASPAQPQKKDVVANSQNKMFR